VGVNVTEQVTMSLFSLREQALAENLPGWLLENFTFPEGVIRLPGLVSKTVTVHVVGVLMWNGDVHDRLLDVLRFSAVITKLAGALAKWVLSPG
jgi:hypothetical protein